MRIREYQRLPTSGARGVELFTVNNRRYLAIPQLAEDDLTKPANMNGGNSETTIKIFQWDEQQFKPYQDLAAHGAEDVHFSTINSQPVIAVANIRSGQDPNFDMKTDSAVYQWANEQFRLLQTLPSFAAKGCHFFSEEGETFLLLSEGVSLTSSDIKPDNSHLYRWDGQQFVAYQSLPGIWGYDIDSAHFDGRFFVSLADNIAPSVIYEWKDQQLLPLQSFAQHGGGRKITFFQIDQILYIAVANLLHESDIYRWDGNQFVFIQTLPETGCRDLHMMNIHGQTYLIRINFITGSREHPQTKQQAIIYQWTGQAFAEQTRFNTFGGTACQHFQESGAHYLVVSNSLSEAIRFRVDSIVYQLDII